MTKRRADEKAIAPTNVERETIISQTSETCGPSFVEEITNAPLGNGH